jgi:hypothetical protein
LPNKIERTIQTQNWILRNSYEPLELIKEKLVKLKDKYREKEKEVVMKINREIDNGTME